MKQCPNCQGLELYDDIVERCPYCNAVLVTYVRGQDRRGRQTERSMTEDEPVRPVDTSQAGARMRSTGTHRTEGAGNRTEARTENSRQETRRQEQTDGSTRSRRQERSADPVFETRLGSNYRYRGIVTGVTSTNQFMRNSLKWFNAIFRGQPFQFGNPVYETNIRIEEITRHRMPESERNIVFYGQAGGLAAGDDVEISAVRKGGRLIARRITNNNTLARIRSGGMISAGVIRLFLLLFLVLFLFFVDGIVSFVSSGGIGFLLSALVGGTVNIVIRLLEIFGPLLIGGWLLWLLIRGGRR